MRSDPITTLTQSEIEAFFWAPIDRVGECWEWAGSRSAKRGSGRDYGHFIIRRDGRYIRLYANRVAVYLMTGAVPAMACHTCDNPPCIRPTHLYPGDAQSNSDDMVERGRKATRLGSTNVGASRWHSRRLHDGGGLTLVEWTDMIRWDRLERAVDSEQAFLRYAERMSRGLVRLPEVIA